MEKRSSESLKCYSINELSEILGVTRRTVWNYVKAGELKGKKLGKEWRITEEHLREFLDGKGEA